MKMNWKKYSDLTNEQKYLISRMYTLGEPKDYMYKCDEDGQIRGRSPIAELVKGDKISVVEVKESKHLTEEESEFIKSDEVEKFHEKLEKAKKRTKKK